MKLFKSKLFVFTLILIIVACVIMLIAFFGSGSNTPVGRVLGAIITPLENGVSKVGDWFSGIFGYFYRYSALLEENQRLQSRLAEYQSLETEYYAALDENEELRKLAGLKAKHRDFDCEMCSVVSYDGSGFQSSFTINKGTVHGIEAGDPVVVEEGLIGYVSEVGPNYANVITLINRNSKVGAMISRTREVVVAEGSFNLASTGSFKISFLKNDADIRVGDWVETTGSGGNYPKGLIIGRVTEFGLESHGISSYAVIEPVVDLQNLTGVFVIKDFQITD